MRDSTRQGELKKGTTRVPGREEDKVQKQDLSLPMWLPSASSSYVLGFFAVALSQAPFPPTLGIGACRAPGLLLASPFAQE